MVKYISEKTCDIRFNSLKEDVCEVNDCVKKIRDNHLPHISADLVVLKTYFKIMSVALGFIITAVINILVKVYFG